MHKLALVAALIASSLPSDATAQEPKLPPIDLPICERFCEEIYSNPPIVVVETDKAIEDFEFCLVEGMSRFHVPPNRYTHNGETLLISYNASRIRRLMIRIVPQGERSVVAGYTKNKSLADRLIGFIQVCTQD